jgi:hypothetical protein
MGFLPDILLLVVITALISFLFAILIRSNPLSIILSAVAAQSLVVLYVLFAAFDSIGADNNVLRVIKVPLLFCALVFFGSAIGFTFLARRIYAKVPGVRKP